MPVGRFIWKRDGEELVDELKRIESLSDNDEFFKAGMLGGSKESAAPTLRKVREFHKNIASQYW